MDDQMTEFGTSAANGDPVQRNSLIRKMAASYIRHQLYTGTKARAIGLEIEGCDLGETRFLAHDADGRISLSMLGLTGKGPTIDAALRHWCDIVEGVA
jgi:hypothetical protein